MASHRVRLSLCFIASVMSSCASMGGMQERYAVCTYEMAWEATLDTVNDRSVTVQDKDRGLIETSWLEIQMPGRSFGALQREVGGGKDRSRIILTVKRVDDVTKVSFIEERERWAFRGGSRLFGWVPSEPSEEAMTSLMKRLDTKLKERGCHTA